MRDSPRRGLQLTALLLGVAAALLLGEGTLRVVRPAALSRVLYPCFYEPDAELGFRYRPSARGVVAGHFEIDNEVETNSLGFYDDEPLRPDEVGLRVLAFGDSFTAAMNVPKPGVWTSVLERELHARGLAHADVVNLGLDGTGTDVHVALMREFVPRFGPDVVLLAFFANDFGDVLNGRFERECYREYVLSYQSDGQRDQLRTRVDAHLEHGLRRWLYRHAYLARLLAAPFLPPLNPYRIQFLQPRRSELAIDDALRRERRARWARTLTDLEEIAAACACRLLVVPVPPRSQADGSLEVWRRQAGESPLEVVDLLPAMEVLRRGEGLAHTDLYFEHDNHLNAAGNALYARALADVLAGPSE